MNKRLDKIYEEIYTIEDQIIDCEKRKEAAEQKTLTQDSVNKILLVFDKFFDKMNKEEQRRIIEGLISDVYLHPKETWEEGKNPVKEIKYTFPISEEVMNAMRGNLTSVETVALLSRKKNGPKIEVENPKPVVHCSEEKEKYIREALAYFGMIK